MKVLVLNSGSSSLKYQVIDMKTEETLAKGYFERIGQSNSFLTHKVNGEKHKFEHFAKDHEQAIKFVLSRIMHKKYGVMQDLSELEGIPTEQRGARFVCALALVTPEGEESVVRGTCEGQILTECLGSEGFGYDPIFYLPELEKTMAQIPKHQKNVLSHRADAFAKLQTILMNLV